MFAEWMRWWFNDTNNFEFGISFTCVQSPENKNKVNLESLKEILVHLFLFQLHQNLRKFALSQVR